LANSFKFIGTPRRLLRDRRGISSVEFALVCSLFFMLVLGVVDFSRAMWEWNAAAKATHWGVRSAVVNNMVSKKMAGFSGVLAGLDAGSSIDPDVVKFNLGTDTFTCYNSGCNGNGDIATSFDANAFDLIVAQMQMIYSRIGPENVVVEYRHVGLGFAGDPTSPDLHPLVTVSLRNMTFDFVTPGLSGIFSLTMPDFAASMTGEDLTSL
jgi:hypothetical protein